MLTLLIFLVGSGLLGALPLGAWVFRGLTGQDLASLGTGNLGVSAAFQRGGVGPGLALVGLEIARGVVVVVVARGQPDWVYGGLLALAIGRFTQRGGGVTNVLWGLLCHRPLAVFLVLAVGAGFYGGTRQPALSRRFGILSLPLWADSPWSILLAAGLVAIDLRLKDDWTVGKAYFTLDEPLDPRQCGSKAANLSLLKGSGFPVPEGWVLPVGKTLVRQFPWARWPVVIVRSSAVGEDGPTASAAGQYVSIAQVDTAVGLEAAIQQVCAAYETQTAQAYRARVGQQAGGMAVLIQRQIQGVISGVLFTRSPVDGQALVLESLAGGADRVVSGQVTPDQFFQDRASGQEQGVCGLPDEVRGDLIAMALRIEQFFEEVPQDIEWIWDGRELWIVQSRPITNLLPLWTRTIAAEVIPGLVRPLTWSINQPLTCGVWGEVFKIVLGETSGLDFTQTATLHRGRAYFNATLLGEIFRRMGLPEQGLEFLVRGQKFSRPPVGRVLKNLPGLGRLVLRERGLVQGFAQDDRTYFQPALVAQPLQDLSEVELWERIDQIRGILRRLTFYNILAPIGLAVRQAVFKIPEAWLNYGQSPEIQAISELKRLAQTVPLDQAEVARVIETYGFLSEANTDIAVPTWREMPQTVYKLVAALAQAPQREPVKSSPSRWRDRLVTGWVQGRVDLKGRVSARYNRCIAELRWTFVELERRWLAQGVLAEPGDIFYLTEAELRQSPQGWLALVQARRGELEAQRGVTPPPVVYGDCWPERVMAVPQTGRVWKGIAGSRGQVEGVVQVLTSLAQPVTGEILVVPYTDAAWAAALVQARGLIAEVGGQLSHGAILAREYGIPAVMNIEGATQIFSSGQRVRLDGARGTVELL